jgi:hypothetical protein
MEYTVAEAVKLTGAKRRTIQLWCDYRVLHQTGRRHKGTGHPRRLNETEVQIAAILVSAQKLQISTDVLLLLAHELRERFDDTILRLMLERDGTPKYFQFKFSENECASIMIDLQRVPFILIERPNEPVVRVNVGQTYEYTTLP